MKKYLVLLSAILAVAVIGCEKLNIEPTDQDSSWKLVKSGDTTVINKTDTLRDTTVVIDSLVLSSNLYENLEDSVVTYELEVVSQKSVIGAFGFDRAYGVTNGIRREILVKSESKLNGVSYAAGNFNSNSEAWKSGYYWSGENVKGMVSFTMANDSVSANFVDTYYSSSATLAKDTMSVSFPALSWTHSSVLDSTSVYNKSNGDSLFKVKDFITTTTFVAEVNPDFVKEGSVSKKSFEVKDTLSLMFFVEPDPEDEVVGLRAYGSVEKRNGIIYGVARWYEIHTLIDSVLVKTQEQAFNAELKAENGEAVYATNATYETTGNGWTGNGNADYIDDATNGVAGETFANIYHVSADKDMTMSYNNVDVVFTTNFVVSEAGQKIGASELVNINNVHYDVYPYSNKVNGVYTVSCGKDAQSVEMSATAEREIRVKAADVITEGVENQSFVAEFVTEGNTLSTKTYYNQWDYATYNYGMETSREGFKHNLNVSAEITGAEDFNVQNKSDLSKEYKITAISETADQTEQVEKDSVRIERNTRTFNVTVNNGKTLQVKVITEKDLTPDVNLGYMSLVDVKDGGLTSTVNGNKVTLQPAVKILLEEKSATNASKAPMRGASATSNVKSYTISTEMVGTYTPQVDTVRVPKYSGKPTVETYVVTDGDSVLVKTESYTPYFAITANNGDDIKASDYAFETTFDSINGETVKPIKDGYFYATRVSGNIKSHLSNCTVTENNEGQYDYDKVVTYKNGKDNFIFNAVVNFTENTDLIVANGEKTVEDVVYNAYAYKTTFNMYYTCAGYADAKSASVSRNILVAKEVEDLVPGTIASMAITAVPAHWTGSSFADGSGHQQAIKGLAIITTDGKGCYIPFAGADDTNTLMPASAAISGANYVDGGYDATYNSGYYLSGEGWKPAVVTENGIQILYKDHGQAVRSLTQKSLSTWSWRNGNYSAYVGGYTFSVKDGVATVKYNEVLVAQFK